MRLINVNDLQEDMVLGRSIYSFNNKLILGAGFRMTSELKVRLIARGYNYVYIMEEGTEDIIPEDIISEEVRLQARSKLEDKADKIQRFFQFKDISHTKVYDLLRKGYLKDVNITYDMKKMVDEIFKDISSTGATYLNSVLFKSADTYQLDHAINVTVLSILIGKKYSFQKSELMDLALGAFLHDFGKIVIEKIKETSNPALADDLLREHPTFGFLLVSNSQNASPIVSQIVNQHHENQDGSGYPIGLKGENLPPISTIPRNTKGYIYRMAEIVNVADAYDKLVMSPISSEKISPDEATKRLVQNAGNIHNKHIVNIFTQIVPHFPVGVYVQITHILDTSLIGYHGIVAKINENNLNKPVIILIHDRHMRRIAPRIIDTSKLKNVSLQLVL